MKPSRAPIENPQLDLFQVELTKFANLNNALVKLSRIVDWAALASTLA